MRKAYIVGIVLIVAGIIFLISASNDVSTYASFEEANTGNTVKIAGTLVKNKEIVYDPTVDANLFSFYLEDEKGNVEKVKYFGAEPQDFEQSEQVVITGKMDSEEFVASEILLKCPSKDKDQEVMLRQNEG